MAAGEKTKATPRRTPNPPGGRQSSRSGSEKREREKKLTFRCTATEAQEITAAASRAGLTVGSYIRSRVLQAPTTRAVKQLHVDRVLLAQVLGQLGKVGGNIHQITKRLNFGDWLVAEDVPTAVAEVRAVAVEIMKALGKQPGRLARRPVPEKRRPLSYAKAAEGK